MKRQSGRVITTLAGSTLALVLALGSANPAFAASGKVKYSSRVRQSADANSKAIGSFSKDATVDLLSQVTDANGQVWYQVNVVGGTGYIRGDLISTTDTVPKASGTGSASTTSTQTAASTQTTTSSSSGNFSVTDTGNKEAYISAGKNCNIRSGPGVSYSSQGSLSNGSSLTITGETSASDGKKWYRISYNGNTGYIRANLVTEGSAPGQTNTTNATAANTQNTTNTANASTTNTADAGTTNTAGTSDAGSTTGSTTAQEADVAEDSSENAASSASAQSSADAQASTQTEDPDAGKQYTIKYEADESGAEVAWLYDNNAAGTPRIKVENLLSAYADSTRAQTLEKKTKLFKIIIIALAAAVLLLLILLIATAARFRRFAEGVEEEDGYEDDRRGRRRSRRDAFEEDEDDEEDEDEEDDEEDEDEEEGDEVEDDEDEETFGEDTRDRVVSPAAGSKPAPRKPKNFMVGGDEDDMEYGFLRPKEK